MNDLEREYLKRTLNEDVWIPTENMKSKEDYEIEMITANWKALQYIRNQSRAICELAISINCMALIFVDVQTEELCKHAVRIDGLALQWIPTCNQTEEICELAVRQNGWALQYVRLRSEHIAKIALASMYA